MSGSRRGSTGGTASGRHGSRARRSRFDASTVLALLLPLVSVGALLLVDQPDPAATTLDRAPTQRRLTSAVVVCPSGADRTDVASDSGATGAVQVRLGGADVADVEVAPDQVSRVEGGDGPVIVQAQDDLAPALLAGRTSTPLASAECGGPVFDEWFTGAGAGAEHTSVLELVNPDNGPAQVDVLAYGPDGAVDAPRLRGVPVPAGRTVRLDLADLAPSPDDLALHLTTTRGRVSATLLDRFDALGGAGPVADYLPSQARPATVNLMLGLPAGAGTRTLVVANPGEREVRAGLEVVTPESVLTPAGSGEIVVAPEAVTAVPLEELLGDRADSLSSDAVGLQLTSSAPVTAAVRGIVEDDLMTAVPVTGFGQETTTLAPSADKRLLLAGARAAGVVGLAAFDEQGEPVLDRRVEVVPGRGYDVALPPEAVLLRVRSAGTEIAGSVQLSGDGYALQRLRPLVVSGAVPSVRPDAG